MFENLTDDNIMLYAAKCYEKPNCISVEFDEDYRMFRYIKRLLQRYRTTRSIKERLFLNHLIVLQNVFGVEESTRMLFLKIDEEDYSALKTFLLFISAMPDVVKGINGRDIISSDIPVDTTLVSSLRNILDYSRQYNYNAKQN